jgi:adenylosuccinate lyase
MDGNPLHALSPLDGRYAATVAALRDTCSEAGLIRERIRVEALWILELATAVPSPQP